MKTLAQEFLSSTEQQQITEAVRKAERQTSGEIVPMVVSASHEYPMAAVLCGAFTATPLALLFTLFLGKLFWLGPQNMWLFLALFCLFYFVFHLLCAKNVRVKRIFLRDRDINEEVEKAALAAFFRERLYRTKDGNGLLIYISVLEKKVWILGDRGIDSKIPPKTWQQLVDDLTCRIRAGNRQEAICQTIEAIGAILREHFPHQKDDENELHDVIVK